MVAQPLCSGGGGCLAGCVAFRRKHEGLKDIDGCVARHSDDDKYDDFAAQAHAMVPKHSSESGRPFRSSSSTTVGSAVAQLRLFDECLSLFNEGSASAACEYLSCDCVWHTVYGDAIEGRHEIEHWSEWETRRGVRNVGATQWVETQPGVFKREMRMVFLTQAAFLVVQQVTIEGELIKEIVVEPKLPALRVALRFARARNANDDEAALEQMSEHVLWRAGNGLEIRGKDAVRKRFLEQRAQERTRTGDLEFEVAQVTDTTGCFERWLKIERVDGAKVWCKQRLCVRSELTENDSDVIGGQDRTCYGVVHKLVEVTVLKTLELVNGRWKVAEDGRA